MDPATERRTLRGLQEPLVCNCHRNCGKASALRAGIAFALDHNFTHVITLDGDGQHLPEDIPVMLRVAEETGADLVIGARCFDRALMPRLPLFLQHHWQPAWLRRSSAAKSGTARADSGCSGWINLTATKLRSRCYELEMEILIKMARSGCTIAHAPVRMVYDDGQARSKMKPVRDTVRVCLWSLAFRFLGA